MPAASKDFVRLADGRMALAPLQQRPESARAPKMPLSYLNDMHSQVCGCMSLYKETL